MNPVCGPGVRPPAVAGSFYPGNADELAAVVDTLLERARLPSSEGILTSAPTSEGAVATATKEVES